MIIEFEMDAYPHEIERVDINGERFYTKDGSTPLPSVTGLLSTPEKEASLAKWRKYNPDWRWTQTKALDRGTELHNAIEHWLLSGGDIQINPKYAHLMPPLIEKMEELIDTVHAVEIQLHNEDIGAAGTADLVCTLRSGLVVIGDYKTSDTKKPVKYMKDYFIQTLTYKEMYAREIGRNVDGCMILNCFDKPKPSCEAVIMEANKGATERALTFIAEQSHKKVLDVLK